MNHKASSSFLNAEELSARLRKHKLEVSVERLIEYADSGYLPHWKWYHGSEVSPPLFMWQEVLSWLETNCLRHHDGLPFPLPLQVISKDLGVAAKREDLPTVLLGLCKNLRVATEYLIPGVYFLCLEDEAVYVGQSVNVHARVPMHTDKEFNRAFFLPVPRSDLTAVEGAFIRLLRPRYNKAVGSLTPSDVATARRYGLAVGESTSGVAP